MQYSLARSLTGITNDARLQVILIANTAPPVAFGAFGTPINVLSGVTGIDILKLSAQVSQ